MKKSKSYLLIIIFSLLNFTGCSDKVNLNKICEEHKEVCDELTQDSWCKSDRVKVIASRVDVIKKDLDVDKYKVLLAYEGYIKCMELASQIQHIKYKEKMTRRKDNLIQAKNMLSTFVKETLSSKHPHLLFYHWTRNSDEEALDRFLQLEGTPALENATDQFNLATYYIKRDYKKTFGFLYRSLELHVPGEEISGEVFQTLATMHYKKKQYKQAYIWLRTYQLTQDKPDKEVETSLQQYIKAFDLDEDFLDKVADTTLDKIEDGEFKSPKY